MSAQRHEMHLLTGSSALDALPGAERAAFRKHLAQCAACADEVRGLRETAARLAMATAMELARGRCARGCSRRHPRARQLPPPGRVPFALGGQRGGRAARSRLIRPSQAGIAAILALAAALVFLLVARFAPRQELRQSQSANHRDRRGARRTRRAHRDDARHRGRQRHRGAVRPAARGGRHCRRAARPGGQPDLPALGDESRRRPVRQASFPPATRARPRPYWPWRWGRATVLASLSSTPAGGTAQPTTTPVVVMPVPVVE